MDLSETTIHIVLKNFNCNKKDINCIPVDILNEICDYIAPILCILMNECFTSGSYLKCLKQACITPIFKTGDSTDF